MSSSPLKNVSLVEIEACIAKALQELTGDPVVVSINGIQHPPVAEAQKWLYPNAWKADFTVSVASDQPPIDVEKLPF